MDIIVKLYALVNTEQTLIAELTDYTGEAVNIALFGQDGLKMLETKELLNGNTIVYSYNNEMAKSHQLELSKAISSVKTVFGFTTIKGVTDSNLAVPVVTRKGEYTTKLKIILPHCSDDTLNSLNKAADVIKSNINKLNERILGLQPKISKKDFSGLTLYWKDSTVEKLKAGVEKFEQAAEVTEEETEEKND